MRFLLLGGSFDPPHVGHAALLRAAAAAVRPDRILVVPAWQAPLKGRPGASAADRLRMVRLGLLPALPPRWRKRCRVDASELSSGRRIYTVDTLRRLKRRHPSAELHFAVGSDSAASFGRWRGPRRLKSLCTWWTGARPGISGRLPAHFRRVPGRMPDASSTEARRRLALGRPVAAMLARAVETHIRRKGLYGTGLLRKIEKALTPERWRHTVAVAAAAERLATRWGLNPDKARLCGMLHDYGRSVPVPRMPAYARGRRLAVPAREATCRNNPLLLHAYISADLARRRFGVKDAAVLSAIRCHTLGGPRMSPLDKLLYVADAVSEDRAYPGVAALRRLARRAPTRAFRAVVRAKLSHVKKSGAWIHPSASALLGSP